MLKHFFKWPNSDELLFALRSVLAAALALWIALVTGQARPFWAPMATTILSLPMAAGSISIRSLSRFGGTCIGVVVSAFILIPFVNYTFLLCLLTGIWISICLYFSMLKRTTAAYFFTVAGWTVPVIMTSVLSDMKFINIQYMMDIAIARAEETGIGFISAVLVHSLVFPRKIGPSVVHQMDQLWDDIRQWIANVLLGNTAADWKHNIMAVKILGNMRILTANLPFDVTNERWAFNGIRLLQDRLTVLIPLVSAIEDNLRPLRKSEIITDEGDQLLHQLAKWILKKDYSSKSADLIRLKIKTLLPKIKPESSWNDTLLVRLVLDLEKLISTCEGCYTRRLAIDDALSGRFDRMPKKMPIPLSSLHKDRTLALFVSAAGGTSIAVIMLLWVASGWNAGFCAPTMASIFFMSFVINDNSVNALKTILHFTIIGLPAAYFYALIVLYSTHSYEMLMMAFAPCIFILAIFIARPPIRLGSTIFMMGIWSTTTMYDLDMANMTSFINGQGFAQCGGITLCLLAAMIFRSLDYAWTTSRLMRYIKTDISEFARKNRPPALLQSIVRMVDRVNLIAPRISEKNDQNGDVLFSLMRYMRIGVSMVRLRSMDSRLRRNGIDITPFLAQISYYFEHRSNTDRNAKTLLLVLDDLIAQVCKMTSTVRKNAAVAALSGIRQDLFPDALPYYPHTLLSQESL